MTESPAELAAMQPTPSEEEMAAVLAAYEALSPCPSATEPEEPPRWRFAGRWWSTRSRFGGWA